MKKIIFFLLFLAFTRVGFAAGISATPVGIGNFFLGNPAISDSSFNQVLGLLVGPTGSPGVAGVSGANGAPGEPGTPGVNGLPGIAGLPGINGVNGRDGTPGINGAQGPAGPAGPVGPKGSVDTLGLGIGEVSLDTCDSSVNMAATQAFDGEAFSLVSFVVSNIAGVKGTDRGCAGKDLTIHIKTTSGAMKQCTYPLPNSMTGDSNTAIFNSSNCSFIAAGIRMSDITTNVGLEINRGV